MFWPWVRARESARWVLRGSDFTKTEQAIERYSWPLSHSPEHRAQHRLRKRVEWLIRCLPTEPAERHYDTMARYGHALSSPRLHVAHMPAVADVVALAPLPSDAPLPEPEIPAWAADYGITSREAEGPPHVD